MPGSQYIEGWAADGLAAATQCVFPCVLARVGLLHVERQRRRPTQVAKVPAPRVRPRTLAVLGIASIVVAAALLIAHYETELTRYLIA